MLANVKRINHVEVHVVMSPDEAREILDMLDNRVQDDAWCSCEGCEMTRSLRSMFAYAVEQCEDLGE